MVILSLSMSVLIKWTTMNGSRSSPMTESIQKTCRISSQGNMWIWARKVKKKLKKNRKRFRVCLLISCKSSKNCNKSCNNNSNKNSISWRKIKAIATLKKSLNHHLLQAMKSRLKRRRNLWQYSSVERLMKRGLNTGMTQLSLCRRLRRLKSLWLCTKS